MIPVRAEGKGQRVMIASGGYERGVVAEPHDAIEPEHAAVERDRAVDVGDVQVHVADAGAGGDSLHDTGLCVRS